MRTLILLSLAALAGCPTNPCKSGTVLLTVALPPGAREANILDLRATLDGAASIDMPLPMEPGRESGTIQIEFPSRSATWAAPSGAA